MRSTTPVKSVPERLPDAMGKGPRSSRSALRRLQYEQLLLGWQSDVGLTMQFGRKSSAERRRRW